MSLFYINTRERIENITTISKKVVIYDTLNYKSYLFLLTALEGSKIGAQCK
jgi:hypothetical protein